MKSEYSFSNIEAEKTKIIPVVNVCEINHVDSGIPADERDVKSIASDKTEILYAEALQNGDSAPVFVGMPHAGEFVPQEIMGRVADTKAFVDGLDAGTAYIFSPRPEEKYIAIRNRISRLVADPNRKPDQIGQNLGVGGGVTWTTNLQEQPVYKMGQEPTKEEITDNVEKYHVPYYRALHSLIAALHEQMDYDEILFLDAHSFPGTADVPRIGLVAGESKPMFILGNQGDTKASAEVMNWLKESIIKFAPAKEEFPDLYAHISEVAKTDPNRGWGGFHNVEYFGHPEGVENENFKIHAIQIEMNMSAFYNDGKYNQQHLDAIRNTIQQAVKEVGEKLKTKA